METPEILRDALAEVYGDYLTNQITKSADDQELTDAEWEFRNGSQGGR